MQNRSLPLRFSAAFFFLIFGFGCTKIDTTTLGSDLVTVDNIHTFSETFPVNTSQGFFINDSTTKVHKNESHIIGNISNDPLFGSTTAEIFVQFKPTFYPYYFGNRGDTVLNTQSPLAGLDSAFVCLAYKGVWGDSSGMTPQNFTVQQISDNNFRLFNDSLWPLNYRPAVISTVLGEASITPQIAKKKVILARGRDSVENQIRIKLNADGMALMNSLYSGQTSSSAGPNNAFYNDSVFRNFLHGFSITATGGNTLYYTNLSEAKSRLEFHLHKVQNGLRDTIVQSFQMYPSSFGSTVPSSSANYVKRDYSGAPASVPSGSDVYLQSAPGTYVNINIPGLTGYTNRIIHRAYLVIEQTPFNTVSDDIFTPPPFLYLDLKDTSAAIPQRYKPVYFDLAANLFYNPDAVNTGGLFHPFPAANVDVSTFGGEAKERYDAGGSKFTRYEINLTRYVQHIASNGYHNYDLRLYAPFNYVYPQYIGSKLVIPFYNPLAYGRVRAGSGSNTTHPMKLVIVYSKV